MLVLMANVIILALAAWCLLFWFPSAYCNDAYEADNLKSECQDQFKFVGDYSAPYAGWGLYICSLSSLLLS